MKNFLSVILILISVGIFGVRISKGIQFKQNVSGYLKRAADANTIKLANEELSKVIHYLEANQITSGYTSIFIKTPDEDIDFWYRNLKASQDELQNLNSESALERTNVLIKLRETLLDKSKVTVPRGLSVYPNNGLWAILTTLSLCTLFFGFMILVNEADKKAKLKAATKQG